MASQQRLKQWDVDSLAMLREKMALGLAALGVAGGFFDDLRTCGTVRLSAHALADFQLQLGHGGPISL